VTSGGKGFAAQDKLFELFQSDLVQNLSILGKHLPRLNLPKELHEALIHLIPSVRIMNMGAKILKSLPLVELLSAMERFFEDLQHRRALLNNQKTQLLNQALALLFEISTAKSTDAINVLNAKKSQCSEIVRGLQTQSTDAKILEKQNEVEVKEFADASLLGLFQAELEAQASVLSQGLIDFEQTGKNSEVLQGLMRAAHSIKGAARVLQLGAIVHLAHVIEDCFVAVQNNQLIFRSDHVDIILQAVDLLSKIAHIQQNQLKKWLLQQESEIQRIVASINTHILSGTASSKSDEAMQTPASLQTPPFITLAPTVAALPLASVEELSAQDRVLRVTAYNLNKLMGLAGESLVESGWLQPFSVSLLNVKKSLNDLSRFHSRLHEMIENNKGKALLEHYLLELQNKINDSTEGLNDRLTELDTFMLRHFSLSDRLYREVVDIRMRPFADGIAGFPRMVRDLARTLDKKVRFEITGKSISVDRDILDKLEAPLSHLIRNAIDHGIELPHERIKTNKPSEGVIKLQASHQAGLLNILISDDGKGIDLNVLRKMIIEKKMVIQSIADKLSETELLEFLFLPGFSTAKLVSEISGRGVGLNAVQTMIQAVSGTVRVSTVPGQGTTFQLLLPLSLSVIRALIVEISGEPYAFPLARIGRVINISRDQIDTIESRQCFKLEEENIGLVSGAQVLELEEKKIKSDNIPIVLINDYMNTYGIVVECFLGEHDLAVLDIDSKFGKIADISAGALLEDGSPVLIVDVEDLVRSVDRILSGGYLHKLAYETKSEGYKIRKRVLVVDNSITVREVECRLLRNKGYHVQTAVNGIDAYNLLKMGNFDLVITDVDMPRMNGIDLIRTIRNNAKMKKLPVMVVSYKEREEDRIKGMEAGANYYLTKSSFHDETLLNAVVDLIGESDE
jgi:two-component system, chemotaxis family, sensor histidine kinase and response regulator WspE